MDASEYITSAGYLLPPKFLRLAACPNLPWSDKRQHFYQAKRCCRDASRAVLPSVAVLTSPLSDNQGLLPSINWVDTCWEELRRKRLYIRRAAIICMYRQEPEEYTLACILRVLDKGHEI